MVDVLSAIELILHTPGIQESDRKMLILKRNRFLQSVTHNINKSVAEILAKKQVKDNEK
mgnify:CR=1 FL=1